MQNLQRRPSGTYVLRLVVPHALRAAFGRREVIVSTGTRELAVAKLVASSHAAKWRAHFFQAAALLSPCATERMTDDEIKRLAEGSPLLMLGGVLPIAQVSSLSGLPEFALLRMASDGKLRLFAEAGNVQGYLVNPASLELQDPEAGIAGGYVVPDAQRMPRTAVRTQHQGRVMVDQLDLPGVCMAIEQDQPVTLVCMRLESAPSDLFIPDEPCKLSSKQFALATAEVEHVRRRAAATIDPDRLKTARAAVASPPTPPSKAHPHAGKRFLDGLAEYAKVWLPVKVHSADERKRIQKGITRRSQVPSATPS